MAGSLVTAAAIGFQHILRKAVSRAVHGNAVIVERQYSRWNWPAVDQLAFWKPAKEQFVAAECLVRTSAVRMHPPEILRAV